MAGLGATGDPRSEPAVVCVVGAIGVSGRHTCFDELRAMGLLDDGVPPQDLELAQLGAAKLLGLAGD